MARLMSPRTSVLSDSGGPLPGHPCNAQAYLFPGEKLMAILITLGSLFLIFVVLLEGFETMVLPRRVTRSLRLTRLFYRTSWTLWRGMGLHLPPGKRPEYVRRIFRPWYAAVLCTNCVSAPVS